MVEYSALVLALVGAMVYLVYMGSIVDKEQAKLKTFLFISSLFVGILMFNLTIHIAEDQGASQSIKDTLEYTFWGWTVFTSALTSYFILYELWWAFKLHSDKKRQEAEDMV